MKTSHNPYAHRRGAAAQTVAASNQPGPYMLLSLTLLLPAVIVAAAAAMQLPLAGIIAILPAYFGLRFVAARVPGKGSMIPNRNT